MTVVNNNIVLKYVLINNIITDGLIKSLSADKFSKFKNLGRLRILLRAMIILLLDYKKRPRARLYIIINN